MSVGQDLLDVPFPAMVQNLAFAIAKGQLALDKSSMETTRELASEKVAIIEEIHEEIVPQFTPVDVEITGHDNVVHHETVIITGASIKSSHTDPTEYTLLQAGLFPTFYQFTESIIEVKMSISQKTTSSHELDAGVSAKGKFSFGFGSVSFAAHVNYKTSNTYSYSAEGSSLLRTTLKPVPPPSRLTPRIVTVNTIPMLQGKPAVVTTT